MSLSSYISSLNTDKWFSFTDTPPTTGTAVNQGGGAGTITLRTSTSASTPTLISDATGPDTSNFWRFTTAGTPTAVTMSATGGFSSYGSTFTDKDWVVGQWVRFNSVPSGSIENALTFLQFNTYTNGGFRLGLNPTASTNPSRIRMALTSGITVYSTDRVIAGVWYFIAVQRTGGDTFTLYINGQSQGSATGSTTASANQFIWGNTSHTETTHTYDLSYFVSAPSSVLTPAVMQAITAERTWDKYKAKVWDIDKNPTLYVPFDAKDGSGNWLSVNKTSTAYFEGGNTTLVSQANAKINAGAMQINAGGATSGASLAPVLGENFTISFWFKRNGLPPDSFSSWTYWYSSSTSNIERGYIRSDGQLSFEPRIGGATGTTLYTGVNVCDNIWHHIAWVRSAGTIKVYVDGTLRNTVSNYNATSMGTPSQFSIGGPTSQYDEYLISPFAFTDANVSALYASSINATNINYTDTTGATASATSPDATWSAETVININYSSDVLGTASAEILESSLSLDRNLDGGGVSIATADMPSATAIVDSNVEYSADFASATTLLVGGDVSTTKAVEYAASPATASALLSSNVFFGQSEQDASYELELRQVYSHVSNNNEITSSMAIGTQSTGNPDTIDSRTAALIKPISGFPAYNKLIKVKTNPAHVTTTAPGGDGTANTFNVYVLTANPTTGTFTTAPYSSFTPVREYLYTTRAGDDASNHLDLTPAFADSRAATYGIMIEHVHTETVSSGTIYDRTEFNGSNLRNTLLYVLSSDIINKTVNADVATASALATDVTVDTQKYVNMSADPSTASADIVNPVVSIQIAVSVSSDPLLASALSVQPAFSSTVEFPHTYAEAFAAPVTPQVFAFGTITYAAAPATASAEFHMPQANIGDDHLADHMNASALFVMPTLIIPRVVAAMTTTASTLFVDPTVNVQLLGVVLASPMTANTDIITPPAYINLLADKWYSTLFTQHSRLHGVRIPISNETGEAILKRFDDVVTPKLIGSTVVNYLSAKILTDSINGDAGIGSSLNVIGEFNPTANPASITPGFFDPYGRKAVRLNNITTGYENSLSFTPEFTFEMSIKTTKADQIIAFGRWSATNGNQRRATVLGISDGKLFVNSTQVIGVAPLLHYKELADPNKQYAVIGNKSIADDQWHHIVVQYGFGDGRVQFWIDGKLDIQRFTDRLEGLNFLGHNASISTYASDFYTSAWSYDANAFILEQDVSDHNLAYINVEPVRAEPMTASALNPGGGASGNKPRALMLYFWPTSLNQNPNLITKTFVDETFVRGLETIDYINQPPQDYYGWDVFPVDVTGYYVSDLVKEEAYGGKENIVEQGFSFAETSPVTINRPKFKVNRDGYFRDELTDTARYIDLVKDIDLSQFDAIFFKNYPDEGKELDSYARNEVVDRYFNLRESVIFDNFVKSLRAAVDTGISLMVTNPQLALDLKIVDRIELVPSLQDTGFYYSDPYTASIAPAVYPIGTETRTANLWNDTFKNNRTRLINTYPGITDQECITLVRAAVWQNDDTLEYGAPDRVFLGYDIKPNGLSVGDEWFFATYNPVDQRAGYNNDILEYLATPIANVKAGTPITAFANQYRRGLDLVDNPYKNYVTSIAIKPGDVLDGKQVGGKIWVNFTDYINRENEYIAVDALHANFINLAYQRGDITLAERDEYLASPDLVAPAVGELTASTANKAAFWQSNGSHILKQGQIIELPSGESDFTGSKPIKTFIRKARKVGNFVADKNSVMGGASAGSVTATSVSGQFFTFTFAKKYDQLIFEAISMNTRGFKWISLRQPAVTQTQTHTAITASATMVQPVIMVQKESSITVQPMLANAIKIPAVGFAGTDRNMISLPLEASATAVQPVKKVSAEPMTVSAAFREQVVIRTTAQDQVVVYVLHEDPILYLREDIIK